MAERVLLTGITGYIGQHCASELLKSGYEVVGTIRSQSKAADTRAALAEVAPVEALSFVEVDLGADAGWAEAMTGCAYVLHVASPFAIANPEDDDEMLKPAVDGTRRVLQAAAKAGVRRVVLTSSTVSITSGHPSSSLGPSDWSNLDGPVSTYARSKTLAEQAAWDLAESLPIDLVAINPGAVFGPSLGATIDGQSVSMMKDLINGKMPMIPDLALGMVDVRDVAKLHVAALTAEGAVGKRFIAATAEPVEFITIAKTLKDAGYSKVSTRRAPTWLMKAMSLIDSDAKGMVPMLGKRVSLDNSATYEILGWQPTPVADSAKEMAASLS